MPSKAVLMGSSAPASLASKLGEDPLTAFTAAGTTQATATTLTSNFANVTTPAPNNGVIMNDPYGRTFIYNSGPNTLLIYPPVGGTMVGLSINAAVNIASGSGADIEGDGLNYLVNFSL